MDVEFFHKAHELYKQKGVSDQTWIEFYNIIFKELAKENPDDVTIRHLELMEMSENFFSSVEDFEKAGVLFELRRVSGEIIKTREEIEKIKEILKNNKENEEE